MTRGERSVVSAVGLEVGKSRSVVSNAFFVVVFFLLLLKLRILTSLHPAVPSVDLVVIRL